MRLGTTMAMAVAMAILALHGGADAQEADEAPPAQDDEVVDEIIVRGGRINPAMEAFRAGDYARAEIEFEKNAMCALRVERNRLAAIEQIQTNQTRQTVQAEAVSNGGSSAEAAQAAPPPAPSSGFQAPATRAAEAEEETYAPTCGNRGYQVYMVGMSQLQLGRIDEAKRNFQRATTYNKNLPDAHYRLGLIALLEGDAKAARRQAKALRRMLRRCRDCDVREEIVASADDLDARIDAARAQQG